MSNSRENNAIWQLLTNILLVYWGKVVFLQWTMKII